MAKDKVQGRKGKEKKKPETDTKEKEMAEKRSKHDSDSDSDSDSGPEDKNGPPPKVSKSGGSGARRLKNDQGDTYFDLSGNKRVTIREFKNSVYVDIREHYEKDGKFLPGKKGISLNTSQWIKLKNLIPDVDDEVQQMA